MNQTNQAVLELQNVSVEIAGAAVLSNISFQLGKGEFVTIIGRNGAGKSSLLKLCFRALKAHSGQITLNDKNLETYSQSDIAKKISYVPQGFDLLAPLDVAEFVRISCYPFFKNSKEKLSDAVIKQALAQLRMADFFKRQLSSLSGGERQRVLLASVLIGRPAIMLLDEPTTYLDPAAQAELFEALLTIRMQTNCAVVMVSHHLTAAAKVSQRVVALVQGEIFLQGVPQEILTPYNLQQIFGCSFDGLSPLIV